jgi:CelD/BcsL family acetyltransferase involved in cellulose biosynthesis
VPLTTRAENTPPDEHDWNALCDTTGASPFVRPAWLLPWLTAFAPDQGCFVTAWDGDELAGILVLLRRFGVVWSATNWHTPVYGSVARDRDTESALADHALRLAPALVVRFVDVGSPVAAVLPEVAAAQGYAVVRRTILDSPRVDVSGTWDDYERGLSKSMVKTLRRRRRRLEELGELTVEVVRSGPEVETRLEEGLQLEHAGWKGRKGTSIASDPMVRDFYRRIALAAAEGGRLSLAFLRLESRVIAFHLDLVDRGVVFGLKGTYAEDLAALSPSRVLRHERIKQAFDEGMQRYEFLGADEPYKSEWANATTTLDAFEIFRPSPSGRAIQVVRTHGRDLARSAIRVRNAAVRRAADWRKRG